MINYLSKRFALTKEGSKNLLKGIAYTTLLNISLMLPVGLYVYLISLWIEPLTTGKYVEPNLGIFIVAILIVLGIIFVFVWKQYYYVFITTYGESVERRINLGESLRKLPLSFFENKDLSDLTSTIMNDSTDLEHTFSHAIPQLSGAILAVILVSIGLFVFDYRLAIALLWVVPVSFILILVTKNFSKKGAAKVLNSKRKCGDGFQECLESVRELKSYNAEENYLDKMEKITGNVEKAQFKAELMSAVGVISGQMVLKLGIVSVIVVGSALIVTNQISIFTFLIFLISAALIYNPMDASLLYLTEIFSSDLKIDRMKDIQTQVQNEGSKDYVLDGYDIEFDDVSFDYDEFKDVLTDISFVAKQGEVTALVGPSGSGKSTVSKLAAKFWDPIFGQVKLGGQNLANVDSEKILENFSIVFQDVILFNSSIMDNIRIGKRNATDEEVIRAAQLAECEDFIKELPDGYDTVIGENGELLSGGQRQRISIARALLKDANVILLDEATSFLDVENESKIQKALSTLIKNKTVLIIAHRMRTIANADKIIVLDEGHIVESGAPDDLIKENGLFKRMVDIQKESQNWEI
ncbi:ABC transporter ATP-binding protein [uncultured Methanobrevibacter sp.]|uniref:ABC transporter ATP-binding protein n=1 Tax=uncultured Methanobrevibacter sp. TaxID=253161 RepID=UPI002624D39F|nr:ABC transporter ATP-binding protein [uncultured Methanobrevibacter sp.]